MNSIETTKGYANFIPCFEMIPKINDKSAVDAIIRTTIPITSVGPAKSGNI